MTVVLILLAVGAGLVVVVVAGFCLSLGAVFAWYVVFEMPVRHSDAVVTGFAWRRTVKIGRPEWVATRSDTKPGADARNVQEQHFADDHHYTYESLLWRPTSRAAADGDDRGSVSWPEYTLGPGEQVWKRSESYTVMFSSPQGRRYKATVDLRQWQSLDMGAECRLGRTVFGSVREVKPNHAR